MHDFQIILLADIHDFPIITSVSKFDFQYRISVSNFSFKFEYFEFEFRLRISIFGPVWSRFTGSSGRFRPDVLALRASLVLAYWPFGPVSS